LGRRKKKIPPRGRKEAGRARGPPTLKEKVGASLFSRKKRKKPLRKTTDREEKNFKKKREGRISSKMENKHLEGRNLWPGKGLLSYKTQKDSLSL